MKRTKLFLSILVCFLLLFSSPQPPPQSNDPPLPCVPDPQSASEMPRNTFQYREEVRKNIPVFHNRTPPQTAVSDMRSPQNGFLLSESFRSH